MNEHPNPGDWPEYFHLENGCYGSQCVECKKYFIGPKHSHVCKVCACASASEAAFIIRDNPDIDHVTAGALERELHLAPEVAKAVLKRLMSLGLGSMYTGTASNHERVFRVYGRGFGGETGFGSKSLELEHFSNAMAKLGLTPVR